MQVSQAQVDAFHWWHSIDFGGGVISNGMKEFAALQAEIDTTFKPGFADKSVLDIGAWNGAFSFAAVQRGAAQVHAVDGFIWADKGWSSKKPFDFANAAFGGRVGARLADIYDMTAENSGVHDVVLFLGVLYHLKHPLLALERVAEMTREYAVIETATGHNENATPFMQFIPGDELAGDPTNWCLPNVACVEAWLTTAGFKRIEVTPHPVAHAYARYFFHAWK